MVPAPLRVLSDWATPYVRTGGSTCAGDLAYGSPPFHSSVLVSAAVWSALTGAGRGAERPRGHAGGTSHRRLLVRLELPGLRLPRRHVRGRQFRQGRPREALRPYDCGTGTFYVHVVTVSGWVVLPSDNDNYVKLGQTQKLVDGGDGPGSSPPAFAYIGQKAWEASFKLAPGSYTGDGGLNVHARSCRRNGVPRRRSPVDAWTSSSAARSPPRPPTPSPTPTPTRPRLRRTASRPPPASSRA
jgi:hypothetical protein